ncbi:hypothetical protein JG688_00011634 [Phytophthora aleatoria]|uniref:Uncharacterized protein n=1 Tax=Phytophthora aleatoria TaxID=2496075 RepID=A0A8J5J3T2_9STRA|nr:hypothetical protein JG688_00011634 [Phytophthora aleatoria]
MDVPQENERVIYEGNNPKRGITACKLADADDQLWSWFKSLELTVVPDVIVLTRMSNVHQAEQK